MSMYAVFMYCFLAIFVATAILTLGALPGWIRLPETYRAKLFSTLILEVIGCVIGFVYAGTKLQDQPRGKPFWIAVDSSEIDGKAWENAETPHGHFDGKTVVYRFDPPFEKPPAVAQITLGDNAWPSLSGLQAKIAWDETTSAPELYKDLVVIEFFWPSESGPQRQGRRATAFVKIVPP